MRDNTLNGRLNFNLERGGCLFEAGGKTVYRLVSEGKLPSFKVGGLWRFKREDLEAWIEEQKNNN